MLIERGRDARYLPTGHLVYGSNGVLLAVPFDAARRQLTGGAVPLVEGVAGGGVGSDTMQFAVRAGALVYVPGVVGGRLAPVLVDRDGREEAIPAEGREYRRLRVSPDGTRVAVEVEDPANSDIWIWDFAREQLTRLTFDAAHDSHPIWTPDGARVVFYSSRDGGGLFSKAADGTGEVERLLERSGDVQAYTWATDGRLIVEVSGGASADEFNIAALAVGGDPPVVSLLDTEFDETHPALSPDGRWLAYQSDESGEDQIYVRPFPDIDDGRWQVSTAGGAEPVWSPGGQELFYRDPEGGSMMAVPVGTESSFTYEAPERLFSVSGYVFPGAQGHEYDISPDGERFVFLKPSGAQAGEDGPPQIVVVQNWYQELLRFPDGVTRRGRLLGGRGPQR